MTNLCVAIFVHTAEQALADAARAAELGADMIEFRIDMVSNDQIVRDVVSRCVVPCIVTCRLTRTPMAPSLRSGPRSSASTHTPERPSTRVVSTSNSRQTRIMTSSSRRTWATTSIGTPCSRTIG